MKFGKHCPAEHLATYRFQLRNDAKLQFPMFYKVTSNTLRSFKKGVPKNNSAYINCISCTKLLVISELVSFMCDLKPVPVYKNTGSHPNYISVSMQ
jgi:hypothetical protein